MRKIFEALFRDGEHANKVIGATGSLVQRSNVMGFFVVAAICISVVCCVVMYVCARVPSLGSGLGYMVLAILLLFFLGAFAVYVYLMIRNPSALRSESYIVTLSQMAVEAAAKGLPVRFDGDGIVDVVETYPARQYIPNSDTQSRIPGGSIQGNEKAEENA